MPRPGRRLIQIAAVLSAVGMMAFVWSSMLWLIGGAVLLIAGLAVLDYRSTAPLLRRIEVSRTVPRMAGRNLPFEIEIRLRHSSDVAISGQIRDVRPSACQPGFVVEPFTLAPQGAQIRTATARIPIRGLHEFGSIWVRVTSPWRLLEVQRDIPLATEIKILPETFASREELKKDLGAEILLLDKVVRTRQIGDGTEFVSLDSYRRGDDPRRIDWRATARNRFPIVRRHQVERHRDVLILIDCGRLMGATTDRGTKLDCAVDAALNLARVALRGGDRCGVGVFDNELRGFLAPVAGPQALNMLVQCVYNVQTRWQESDFTRIFAELQRRQLKRSLLVVISDVADAETSRTHCAALAKLSRRHLVLFAALRTPLFRRIVHHEPETFQEGARQAVAFGLLRDRARALHELRHGGVKVLDVEPQQLSLPLINQFIELRKRNQL
jgi:uncharacterized protein (DUF58 family)